MIVQLYLGPELPTMTVDQGHDVWILSRVFEPRSYYPGPHACDKKSTRG